MRLEDIGFYTLSDQRVHDLLAQGIKKPLHRCELLLTSRCNLRCPYCRGLKPEHQGNLPLVAAYNIVETWLRHGLRNVRFSGGEPTLYGGLADLVRQCRDGGVEHIAVSTNGTASMHVYEELLVAGMNDVSVSLDAGCCAIGDCMTGGVENAWEKARATIEALAKRTYVTVGMVFTETNYPVAADAVRYVDSLGPADIRIIPSAQYNRALENLAQLAPDILARYPILQYRVQNLRSSRHVRGIRVQDAHRCHLALDDMAVVGNQHYPCIIYLREMGEAIGQFGPDVREQRLRWWSRHDPHDDPICRHNCLDVCVDYNNRVEELGHAHHPARILAASAAA